MPNCSEQITHTESTQNDYINDNDSPPFSTPQSWSCDSCKGTALAPDGLRFKKKIWTLGTVTVAEDSVTELVLTIALRLDRNATKPCLELLLIEPTSEESKVDESTVPGKSYCQGRLGGKLGATAGYLLIEVDNSSNLPALKLLLRGYFIDPSRRNCGLSKVLLDVYLRLNWMLLGSSQANVVQTRKIDKPLLSLVLQKAGFEPERTKSSIWVIKDGGNGGGGPESAANSKATAVIDDGVETQCEKVAMLKPAELSVSPSGSDQQQTQKTTTASNNQVEPILLWSDNPAQTRSLLALSYLKTQNMKVLNYFDNDENVQCRPPNIMSQAFINTAFTLSAEKLREKMSTTTSTDYSASESIHMSGFCARCFQHEIGRLLLAWQKINEELKEARKDRAKQKRQKVWDKKGPNSGKSSSEAAVGEDSTIKVL